MLTPIELRCEYKTNPLGIDVTKPRLYWILAADSPARAQLQSAYQIQVASTPDQAATNQPDLWDSGKVASDQNAHIVYAGKPLQSRQDCWWRVRVWDQDGKEGPWSAPARWSMGLLAPADWQAQWIGAAMPVPYLRASFNIVKPIKKAMVYASALGLFELHSNGQRIGADRFTPGWSDYHKRVYYLTYDITEILQQGKNGFGAILAPGWYCGYIGWAASNNFYGEKSAFIAQIEIEFADGSTQTILTNEKWKASEGQIQEAELLNGELQDARRNLIGWCKPGYDDSRWQPVELRDNLKANLEAYPGIPVRKTEELPAKAVSVARPGHYIFDLGQNMVGHARLKFTSNPGRRIMLRFAEMLNPDGTLYVSNLRRAQACDIYYTTEGEQVFEPRFTFHGFRYVEVGGLPASIEQPGQPTFVPLDLVTGVVMNSDTTPTGTFECSSEMVNKLFSNISWGQRGNYFEVPTDCPQRDERLGWTGDAQVFIRTASYLMDVAPFFTKWLVDLEDAQRPNGAFTDVAPHLPICGSGEPPWRGFGTAAWGDAGTICPWTIYQMYGDTRILERHYNAMCRWVDYLKFTTNQSELLRPAEGYGDWLSINADTPKDVLATAYFAYSTLLTAKAARVLGKTADAENFEKLFEEIKASFNEAYVAEDGRITGNTQTCYLVALVMDLLPEAKRKLAASFLVEDIESRGGFLSTGFVGVSYLNPILSRYGYHELAYRLLNNTDFPSWGYSIKHGATTIWERWDGWTETGGFQDVGMNSFNHYSLGSVGEWMFETMAGIHSDGAGFKNIIIKPIPGGDFDYVQAGYKSINGRIASQWKINDQKLALLVTIPPNTRAKIYLPTGDADSITDFGEPLAQAEGIQILNPEDGFVVLGVGSGEYLFTANMR